MTRTEPGKAANHGAGEGASGDAARQSQSGRGKIEMAGGSDWLR